MNAQIIPLIETLTVQGNWNLQLGTVSIESNVLGEQRDGCTNAFHKLCMPFGVCMYVYATGKFQWTFIFNWSLSA